jgi:hypothetical protein
MGIVEQAAEDRAQQRRAAYDRYVSLLEENSSDAAKVKELHAVMDTLGKSAADVQREAGVLRGAAAVRGRIDAAKGAGVKERAAAAAIPQFEAETERLLADRKLKLAELQAEHTRTREASAAATRDVELLNRLKNENEELLRQVKPAVLSDVD